MNIEKIQQTSSKNTVTQTKTEKLQLFFRSSRSFCVFRHRESTQNHPRDRPAVAQPRQEPRCAARGHHEVHRQDPEDGRRRQEDLGGGSRRKGDC